MQIEKYQSPVDKTELLIVVRDGVVSYRDRSTGTNYSLEYAEQHLTPMGSVTIRPPKHRDEDYFVNQTGDIIQGSLELVSDYPSDDVPNGEDGTRRLNLQSQQRANTNSFGETIRHFLIRKDAKAMEAYYVPKAGYDENREAIADFNEDGSIADITQWQPVSWTGSHFEANDHNSNHVHWELEIPDASGALQGRLEVPFADPVTGTVGLNKTFIRTNLCDFVVRTSNGQMLRLSSSKGTHKPIEFNHDSEGNSEFRRWILRANDTNESGSNNGTDFQLLHYADDGTFLGQAMHVDRRTGNVVLGSSSSTFGVKLDINGGRIRLRSSTPPPSANGNGQPGEIAWDANYMYVCVATNTWKRSPLSSW